MTLTVTQAVGLLGTVLVFSVFCLSHWTIIKTYPLLSAVAIVGGLSINAAMTLFPPALAAQLAQSVGGTCYALVFVWRLQVLGCAAEVAAERARTTNAKTRLLQKTDIIMSVVYEGCVQRALGGGDPGAHIDKMLRGGVIDYDSAKTLRQQVLMWGNAPRPPLPSR